MMLSSVAERVYWLGRYLERAENSARLISAYSALLFDLPRGSHISWPALLDITGGNETFVELYKKADENNIMKFLINDVAAPSSIFSVVSQARENARTAREIIPSEAWEKINELYLTIRAAGSVHSSRIKRHRLLRLVVADCELVSGMLHGCMSRNDAYAFIKLGRELERGDMITRVVDVGSLSLLPELSSEIANREQIKPYEGVVWMNVLRCLSAFQSYQQQIHNRVEGEAVVRYLLQNQEFPRALSYCLNELSYDLKKLPNSDEVLRAVARVSRICKEVNISDMLSRGVMVQFIDELQISIADIHDEVSATWFRPASLS